MRAAWICLTLLLGWLPGAVLAQVRIAAQEAWIEDGRSASIEQVVALPPDRFRPSPAGVVHPTGAHNTLWLRLRIELPAGQTAPNGAGGAHDWGLDIPVPLLDAVTLYQRDGRGRWERQSAGDHLPLAQWRLPGRYPSFEMDIEPARASEVYLQVRHSDPIGLPLRIGPESELEQTRQVEYLGLGMMLGTLLLLAASCLMQAAIHRDRIYGWYALYAAAMALTIATVTGLSTHLLWNDSPRWADAAQGVLPVMMAGLHLLFMRDLCRIAVRHPRLARVAQALGLTMLFLGLAFLKVDPWVQSLIVAFSLATGMLLGVAMAVLAWRRHDEVGGWVLLAYLPLAVMVASALLRLFGLIGATWVTLDASAGAAALAVPLLMLALNARLRDRHGARTRVNKLTQQDALTGLLSAQAFGAQLQAAVSGALMRREHSAVVLVEIVNLAQVRRFHGDAMAEQLLLRAVIKLHRVIRDSDPAGRITTHRFAVVFEGMNTRAEVQERMVRLVASGLVPARGAAVEVPIQFHVACLMLGERLLAPDLVLRELSDTLRAMARRTRRPVRFVEPAEANVSAPGVAPEATTPA